MFEVAFLFLGFGLGALAFMPRRGYPRWFGHSICPLCRKVGCYGVDAECKAFALEGDA